MSVVLHDQVKSLLQQECCSLLLTSFTFLSKILEDSRYAFLSFLIVKNVRVLSATNRFDPECEPHFDDVLNQESIHCS